MGNALKPEMNWNLMLILSKTKSTTKKNWAPKYLMKIKRRLKRLLTKRFPGWKKIRKPKVKNSELKRKNWRMLCSQSSLNCINRVVDHPHQVEKVAKKTSIRMSCKSCCYIGIVSSFLADVSSHPRFSSK